MKIAVCGIACEKCPRMVKKTCPSFPVGCVPKENKFCQIATCAFGKGVRLCFECAEFPCDKLQAFASDGYEHHRLAVENLQQMKALGLDKWLAQQPKPMFCSGWRF